MLQSQWLNAIKKAFNRHLPQSIRKTRRRNLSVGVPACVVERLEDRTLLSAAITSILNDTGILTNDFITNVTNPQSVTGTAIANSTVTVTDGGVTLGTTTANSSGNWTYAGAGISPLAAGTHSLQAADSVGAQINTITITGGANNNDQFQATINGTTVTYQNVSGGAQTAAVVAAGLRAAINGNVTVNTVVNASDNGTGVITLRGILGPAFTFTLNSVNTPGTNTGTGAMSSSVVAAQVNTITIGNGGAIVLNDQFTATINGTAVTFSAAGAGAAAVATGLRNAINANATVNPIVSASDDGAGVITLTAKALLTTFSLTTSKTGAGTIASVLVKATPGSVGPVNVVVDTTAPTTTAVAKVGQINPTSGASVEFTVTFSEAVYGFNAGDVQVTTGGGTAFGTTGTPGVTVAAVGTDRTTYTVTVTGMIQTGPVTITVPNGTVTDAAGNGNVNAGNTATVTRDVTAPTLSLNQVGGADAVPFTAVPVNFTVLFSEPVTGFDASKVAVSGTAGAATAVVTGGSQVNTVLLSGANSAIAGEGYTITITGTGSTPTAAVTKTYTTAGAGETPAAIATALSGLINADATLAGLVTASDNGAGLVTVTGITTLATFTIGSGTVGGLPVEAVTIGAPASVNVAGTYNIAVNDMTKTGLISASIAANAAIKDAAGNSLATAAATGTIAGTTTTVTLAGGISAPGSNFNVPIIAQTGATTTAAATVTYTTTVTESTTTVALGLAAAINADATVGPVVQASSSGSVVTITNKTSGFSVGITLAGLTTTSTTATISASASGGPVGLATDIINFADQTAPFVSSIVRVGANPTNASSVNFTVTFNEAVTGVDTTDFKLTPTGPITGASIGTVTPVSSKVYTVAVNTGSGTGALRLDLVDDDSIKDITGTSLGNSVGGTNGSFSTGESYTIDKTGPAVTVSKAPGQNDPHLASTNGSTINFRAVFNEYVTGLNNTSVTLAGSANPTTATVLPSSQVSTVTVGGTIEVSDVFKVVINGAGSATFTPPTAAAATTTNVATQLAAAINTTYGGAGISATASGAVVTVTGPTSGTAFSIVSTTTNGGTDNTQSLTTVTGKSFNIAVSGMKNNGTVTVTIPAGATTDLFGNPNTVSNTGTIASYQDDAPPTVSSIALTTGQVSPTNATTVSYTVTFTEAVSGVDVADFSVNDLSTTVSGASVVSVAPASGPAQTYTVIVNTGSGSGAVRLNLVDNDTIVDGQGNKLGGVGVQTNPNVPPITPGTPVGNASFAGNLVTIDKNAPTVTINQAVTQIDPIYASASTTINYTTIFSRAVTGFTNTDVQVAGTAGPTTAVVRQESTLTVGGTPVNATVTVSINGTPVTSSPVASTVNAVATNLASTINANATLAAAGITASASGAVITVQGAANGVQYLLTVGAPTGGATLTLNEIVGTRYNVAASGMANSGTVTAVVVAGAARDSVVGNASVASTSTDNSVTYNDDVKPTAAISIPSSQPNPTSGNSVTFLVTFSENVSGVSASNFMLTTTGTFTPSLTTSNITSVTGNGNTRLVQVSNISGSGTLVLNLANNSGVADLTGNAVAGLPVAGPFVTVSQSAPAVTIAQAATQADPTNSAAMNYTVTFSTPVTGFDKTDVSIATTGGATGAAAQTVTGGLQTDRITISVTGVLTAGERISTTINGTQVDYFVTASDVALANNAARAAALGAGLRAAINANATTSALVQATDDGTGVVTITSKSTLSQYTVNLNPAETLANGTAALASVATALTYNVLVTGAAGSGTVTATIGAGKATDAAGTSNAASTTGATPSTDNQITYDNVAPTVAVSKKTGQADLTAPGNIVFTVVFSKPVVGFDASGLVVGGTATNTGAPTIAAVPAGNTTNYEVTIPATGTTTSGTVTLSTRLGAATDLAGNFSAVSTNTSNAVNFTDATNPVVNSITSSATSPTSAPSSSYTVVFSKPVTSVDASDFQLILTGSVQVNGFTTPPVGNGITSVTPVNATSGAATTWTVVATTGTGDGTIALRLVDDDSIQDLAGLKLGGVNPPASNFTSAPVTIDKTAPTVNVSRNAATANDAIPASFSVAFVDASAITGFDSSKVLLTGSTAFGTTGTPVITVNSPPAVALNTPSVGLTTTTFTVTVTGMTVNNGTVVLTTVNSGAVVDAANNLSGAPTAVPSNTVTYNDSNSTGVSTIVPAATQTSPTSAATGNFTVTFNELVTGVTSSVFSELLTDGAATTVTGATNTGLSVTPVSPVTVSGVTYAKVYTVTASTGTGNAGNVQLIVKNPGAILDLNNNPVSGPAPVTGTVNTPLVVDRIAPNPTIVRNAGQLDPTTVSPVTYDVAFGKAVVGFDASDVSVAIGAGTAFGVTTPVVNVAGPVAGVFTVTVSGMDRTGTVTPSIAAGAATDVAGNASTAAATTTTIGTFATITVTGTGTTAAGETYTATISGNAVNVNPAVGQTAAQVATLLFNAINANGTVGPLVVATNPSPGVVVLVPNAPNTSLTLNSVSTSGGAVLGINRVVSLTFTDNVAPIVVAGTGIVTESSQANPTNASALDYTVTFSEPVTGVDISDFTLTTVGVTGAAVVAVAQVTPSIYTVTVSSGTGDGTVRLNLVDDDSIRDLTNNALGGAGAGNGTFTPPGVVATYTVTKTGPTVTINQAATQADPQLVSLGSTINFTTTFSTPVTGFMNNDVVLGGTAGATTAVVRQTNTLKVAGTINTGNNLSVTINNTVITAPTGATSAAAAATALANAINTNAAMIAAGITASNGTPATDTVTVQGATNGVTFTLTSPGGTGGATLTLGVGETVGALYNVAVTGMANSGTVTAFVGASAAEDLLGNDSQAATFTDNQVTYTDDIPPTVTITKAAGQSDPQQASTGSTINFTVTFSEPVVGFTASDVVLTSTAGTVTAAVSGTGPTYNVAVTGMTQTGIVTANIPGGAASDASGNGNLPAGSSASIGYIDNVGPTVTVTPTTVSPTTNTTANFSVVFSESVTGFTLSDLSLGGTAPGTKTATITGSGSTYTVAVTGYTGAGTVTVQVIAGAVSDSGGNPSTASGTASVTYDNVAPTVTINQAATQSDPTNATTINFTVVFSEAVTGFTNSDVVLGGTAGATTAVISGTGPTYNVAVSGMTTSGTVTATIPANAAQDLAGNNSAAATFTDNSVTFDNVAPTVTINQASGQADPTSVSPVNFTVVFSEAMTGFTNSDVVLTGTAGATVATVTNPSADNKTFNVAVSGIAQSGTIIATIPANAATDLAGNNNSASTTSDNQVTFSDTTPPSVTITPVTTSPTNSTTINFSVVFSESVTGFTNADLTLGGTAPGSLSATVTGSGTTYTVAVTGYTGPGTVTAAVVAGAASDPSGNLSTASTTASVTYDNVAPTVTINQAATQTDPTKATTINFTVVFSEAVTGFTNSDVVLGGTAGATTVTVTGTGPTYNVAVSGMTTSGTVTATIPANAVTDLAGNNNAAATFTDNSVTFDNVAPTVTINQAVGQADPAGTSPVNFTVVFSEAVTGFTNSDVVLSGTAGATTVVVTNPSADNKTFNAAVSGMISSGTVIATVPAGAATDTSGNSSAASTSTDNSISFADTTSPTTTITAVTSSPTNSSTINFSVVFSKPVTGFTNTDLTLGGTAGGTKTAVVTGSGTAYNVAVSGMTGSGTVTAAVVAGAAIDSSGNLSLVSGTASVTFDNLAPTVTINQAATQSDPTNAASINFTVVFSEAVTGFTNGDVLLGGTAGATTVTVSGSGTTYNVAVSGMTVSGTVTASVVAGAATDAVGNASVASTSTDNSVTFDTTPPTVTINQATGQFDPTNTSPVNFTVVFSEPVTGFANSDVGLTGTAGATTATVTGSGSTYNVAVSGMSSAGTVIASIGANAATDLAGNGNTASVSTDNSIVFDNVAPTVTINQAAGQSDPTSSSTINFTVVFSEPVIGFGNGKVLLGGTAGASTEVVTGSGTTYNVAVSGMTTPGTVIATIGAGAVTDAAGNISAASTSTDNSVTVSSVTLASSRFFRAYNPFADFHFFTMSLNEFNFLKSLGYQDESTGQAGFGISPNQVNGTLPIHRFFIPSTGDHYYTIDQGIELAYLNAHAEVYKSEGVSGFLWSTQVSGTVPVFQLYNNISQTHLFTTSGTERDALLAKYPGIWVPNTNFGFAVPQNAGTFVTGGATQVPARSAAAMGDSNSPATTLGNRSSDVSSTRDSSLITDLTTSLAGRLGSSGGAAGPSANVRGSSVGTLVVEERTRDLRESKPIAATADQLDQMDWDNFWETVSAGQSPFWDRLN